MGARPRRCMSPSCAQRPRFQNRPDLMRWRAGILTPVRPVCSLTSPRPLRAALVLKARLTPQQSAGSQLPPEDPFTASGRAHQLLRNLGVLGIGRDVDCCRKAVLVQLQAPLLLRSINHAAFSLILQPTRSIKSRVTALRTSSCYASWHETTCQAMCAHALTSQYSLDILSLRPTHPTLCGHPPQQSHTTTRFAALFMWGNLTLSPNRVGPVPWRAAAAERAPARCSSRPSGGCWQSARSCTRAASPQPPGRGDGAAVALHADPAQPRSHPHPPPVRSRLWAPAPSPGPPPPARPGPRSLSPRPATRGGPGCALQRVAEHARPHRCSPAHPGST